MAIAAPECRLQQQLWALLNLPELVQCALASSRKDSFQIQGPVYFGFLFIISNLLLHVFSMFLYHIKENSGSHLLLNNLHINLYIVLEPNHSQAWNQFNKQGLRAVFDSDWGVCWIIA